MAKTTTRQDLQALLHRGQSGELTHRSVLDWANERYAGKHRDTEDVIVDQVLVELYSLDMNLAVEEDIPHPLRLLEIPRGQIGLVNALKRDCARSINLQARRLALANDPLYGPHCELAK